MNTNSLKTVFFMVLLMVIFVGLGGMLAGRVGMIIACLLYTSPSPRDRQKSRMPSSA